jgi:aspartate ammonia-lyase
MPLIAVCLLESLDLMERSCRIFREFCIDGIEANEKRCALQIETSTATATALLPFIGYQKACEALKQAAAQGRTLREIVIANNWMTAAQFDAAISPEAVCKLGH